jgi:hypothetical protein
MILYKGEKLYFFMHEDGEYDEKSDSWTPRTFTVHRLKPEALKLQEYWHNLFCEMVGEHCTYDENGEKQCDFSAVDKPDWLSYYARRVKEYEPNEPDLDDPSVAELVASIAW